MKNILGTMLFLIFLCENSPGFCMLLSNKDTTQTYENSERKLTDNGKPKNEKIAIEQNLSKDEKKLKFFKIIQKILLNAKERRLEIKSIKLGAKLGKIFENKDLKAELNKYINDKRFDQKIAKLKEKIARTKRERKLELRNAKKMSFKNRSFRNPRKLQKFGLGGGKGGMGGSEGNKMNFQFLPGIAGVPFPPMMMNGPHYHPPVSVTVNSIPNPNPRSSLNPFEIEQTNLTKQVDELSKIKKNLKELNSSLKHIDEDVETNLNDKYQRVLEIGN